MNLKFEHLSACNLNLKIETKVNATKQHWTNTQDINETIHYSHIYTSMQANVACKFPCDIKETKMLHPQDAQVLFYN